MSTSPNRMLGIVLGLVYLLVGVFGFFVTSSISFLGTSNSNRLIGMFSLNPLQNLIHIAIGVILVLSALAAARAAKGANILFGAIFLIAGIVGLFLTGAANIFAFNAADNILHLLSAVLLLAVGLGADKLAGSAK
jgi:hypothetical protein